MSSWFGNLDLAWKFGLVFGAALVAVLTLGTIVWFVNKRRLSKILERQGGLITLPADEEALNVRQKDAGDLFGIRAIEAGFYGGVFQSPRPSPAGSPGTSGSYQSSGTYEPNTSGTVKVAESSIRPLFFVKPVDGSSNTVASVPHVDTNNPKNPITARRPSRLATGQQFLGQRFPVTTRAPTRLQPTDAELSGRVNHQFRAYKPYKPTSPLAVTEVISHPEASGSRHTTSQQPDRKSNVSGTESDPDSAGTRSSGGSNVSRSSSGSSHTSVFSMSTVRELPSIPHKTVIGRTNKASDTDMARQKSSRSQGSKGLTKAEKALARRSSSTVGAALEGELSPRQSCLHAHDDRRQDYRRHSYVYDLEELVADDDDDDKDEDFTLEFDPEIEPESSLSANSRWSYLKPRSAVEEEFGHRSRPKEIVIPLQEMPRASAMKGPKSPLKQVTFTPSTDHVAHIPRTESNGLVFTGPFY